MDWFDRISIGALAVLSVGTFVLVQGRRGEVNPDRDLQQRAPVADAAAANGALATNVQLIKNLIEAGNLSRAESMIRELKQKFGYQGELSMLMGDVLMRKQQPVMAMHEYKEAIDLNPDYLDKKTPLFQGKKMKIAVEEALAEIENRNRQSPDDPSLKHEKKVIYYLYRRIAGSCS
jgi:lipopolysaccharide biosynthesis regulator YciM